MQVRKNAVVTLKYRVIDSDDQVVDEGEAPIVYLHGGYDAIFPRIEEALQGREAGDELVIRLQPDDAFGEYDASMVFVESRQLFPENIEVGLQFERSGGEDDEDMLFTITDIADDKVVVDGNHPLAGTTLVFSCTIADVREATAEELQHGHAHGAGGHSH